MDCCSASVRAIAQGAGQQVQAGGYGFLGFFQRAKQGASVTAVLANLKENLRSAINTPETGNPFGMSIFW